MDKAGSKVEERKQGPRVMITTYNSNRHHYNHDKFDSDSLDYCSNGRRQSDCLEGIEIHRQNKANFRIVQADARFYSDQFNNNNNNTNNNNNSGGGGDFFDNKVTTNTEAEKSTDLFNHCKRSALIPNYQIKQKFKNNQRGKVLIDLNQIRGPNGSVRGHIDVVRRSLENIKVVQSSAERKRNFTNSNLPTFMAPKQFTTPTPSPSTTTTTTSSNESNQTTTPTTNSSRDSELQRSFYLDRLKEEEHDLCVAYTTTLGIIRRTFEDSKLMKSILNLNLIKYEERDIYLNQEYKEQLKIRCQAIKVPVLFVNGTEIGGIKELEILNENGKLSSLLAQFKMETASKEMCQCCGNARFIACQSCNGSRKSTIHHFKFNSIALRCTKCDKNDGIIQCPVCFGNDTNQNEISNKILAIQQTKVNSKSIDKTTILDDNNNNNNIDDDDGLLCHHL